MPEHTSPNPFREQIIKAEELMQAGHPQMALQIFDLILRADPENVEALNDAALAKAEVYEPFKAVRLFEMALGIDPTHTPSFYNLIDLLLREDVADLAAEAFECYGDAIPETEEKARYRDYLASAVSASLPAA